MTWHKGAQLKAWRNAWALIIAGLCAAGCGSSGSKSAKITILAPEDMAELTIEDDIDPDLPGVQYEVRAQTQNIKSSTIMLLVIPGENTAFFSEVDEDGLVTFEKATLPPGAHTFHITTSNAAISSAEFSYTLKALVIGSPRDGAGIAFGDDIDHDKDGLQINVTVKSYAVDGNEDITLYVDDKAVGDAVSPDEGVAVFKGVTLSTGTHALKAKATDVESSVTTVNVNEACASVTFVSPEVPGAADRLTLGGTDSCPENGQDFTVDFVISTDAGDGRDIELTVNNTTKQRTKVSAALAKFEGIVLNRRMSANEVFVTVQGAGGVTCAPVPYPKDIFVDCDGSDCSIGSPIPYSGQTATGAPAFYLNKSMLNGDGFDIRVDSDSGVIGKKLMLIVDRQDGRYALSSEAVPNGNRLSATFSSVKLAQGTHTIEARCIDGAGNVTESGELNWTVDTDTCSIDIDEPASNALILPADDNDSNPSNGVMVQVKASVAGSDCIEKRTGVCNPSAGVDDEFAALSGGSIDESVTLTSGADQQVCVEARDRANNIALASVALKYRSALPAVQFESPANDTSFNALGNADHTADSDTGTPACDADFRIACTEIGGTVQLHRDDENGAVIASGGCESPADSDPAVPSGFSGRAELSDVAFLPPGVDNVTLVATQTLAGNSTQTLIGKSDPISLTGWCQLPPVTLFAGCPAEQIELPMGGGNVVLPTVRAVFNGPVVALAPEEAQLTVTGPGGIIDSPAAAPLTNGAYQFANVSLGNTEETVETKVELTDGYANTKTITCPTMLVSDLPDLTITSPADGASIGPSGVCSVSDPNKFGVSIALTLDMTTMRMLSYTVNGGAPVSVPMLAASMNLCIPVSDGMNTIAFALDSTTSAGSAKPSVTVSVDPLVVTQPAQGAALLPANDACDPGFGARVQGQVASIFNGSGVTVTAGSAMATATVTSGAFDTCVQAAPGANTITVSLDGKSVTRAIDVSVVSGTPTHSIPLTSVTLPSGNSYRTGSVTIGWATPEQDFAGQLKGYELRCAVTAIQASAAQGDKDTWWNSARVVPLNVVPPATSSAASIRIGENVNCVVRGRDAANQLTPIPDSSAVNYPFREVRVDVPDLHRMGYAFASIGDVNDDDVDDVLVGGQGQAYLYFGNSGGVAGKTSPDVTFRGSSNVGGFDFGTRVVALGDVNGDGENDFAIGHPNFAPNPATANVGVVYLFYGRKNGDSWPASIDLTTTTTTTCGADVCFLGELAGEYLGAGLSPAGDFNNDGRPDIAIGAAGRALTGMNADSLAGRLYVLLGRQFQTASSRPTQFWNVMIRLPSGDPFGFYVDGGGITGNDATSSSQMGTAIAAVGNVDSVAGGDLLVTAAGRSGPVVTSKLFFLGGATHDGNAPRLRQISTATLQLKDTGTQNSFAVRMAPLRNFYDATQTGVPDVAVFDSNVNDFHVYLGDQNGSSQTFANDTRITVQGPAVVFGNSGLSASRGYNPNISNVSRSNLDGDGLDDLCVGPGNGAGPLYVFYGRDVDEALMSNTLNYTAATQISVSARPGTTARTVQPVGDITGDGNVDLVVGEPSANSNAGGFTVLY